MKNINRSLLFVLSAISLILIQTQRKQGPWCWRFSISSTRSAITAITAIMATDCPLLTDPFQDALDILQKTWSVGPWIEDMKNILMAMIPAGLAFESTEIALKGVKVPFTDALLKDMMDVGVSPAKAIRGFGPSEEKAARDAIFQCRNERLIDCRVVECNRGRGEVSTRSCGRRR
ncbi:MAG: hypothetical protein IPJ71_19095 [Bdellovibrionales bacterium]|nr:hypothetical protein [Bdellovibrionales bacterium]